MKDLAKDEEPYFVQNLVAFLNCSGLLEIRIHPIESHKDLKINPDTIIHKINKILPFIDEWSIRTERIYIDGSVWYRRFSMEENK